MINKGYLIGLQHYSVNDGDGIRTVLFLAGCPLRCQWCSNPEGFNRFNKVVYLKAQCIGCGHCVDACPYGVGINLNEQENRRKCRGCGKCVTQCPTSSRQNMIMERTVDEVISELERQLLFFRQSGGGVTYSGGECTSQAEFLGNVVNRCYDMGLNQTIETSALFDFDLLRPVLEKMDLIFTDIKMMDDRKHRFYTGVGNQVILENIKKIAILHQPMVIRIPIILGVNATEENVRATARFVKENIPDPCMELLPYHAYGKEKYDQLGLRHPDARFASPSDEELELFKEIIAAEGVKNISYR